MDRYQVVIDLIKNNSDIIDFADYGDGIPKSWIEIVEKRLNVVFPPSYVWWLKNYGGGRVYGDEIFSIYGIEFDNIPGGDIVYRNELYRKDKTLTEKQLAILSNDFAETFYLDLNQKNENGEYPVYRYSNGDKYTDDFLEFLRRQIVDEEY